MQRLELLFLKNMQIALSKVIQVLAQLLMLLGGLGGNVIF